MLFHVSAEIFATSSVDDKRLREGLGPSYRS